MDPPLLVRDFESGQHGVVVDSIIPMQSQTKFKIFIFYISLNFN